MQRHPKIGLLPLYLGLYDEIMPERRLHFEPFLDGIEQGLRHRGIDVLRARICCRQAEIEEAVDHFETGAVDLLVTLHLAYSPSLEAVDPLSGTSLPLLLLDTTMDYDFGPGVDAGRIMTNHGIHGVQDLACMLRRLGKPYRVIAGHCSESDVLDRAAASARGAYAAVRLGSTQALRIGSSFPGMGDFSVDETLLEQELGITVDQVSPSDLAGEVEAVSEAAVREEMENDLRRFEADVAAEVHARSVRVGLGVRAALARGDYSAFSVCFLDVGVGGGPFNVVPFLEASKAMSRGIGYAGEGDVLTAGLVGALAAAFGRTTFTEMFCPDWKGGAVFLSHMGEINPDVVAGKALLVEKEYRFSPALNPAIVTGAPAPGPAVLVNLAPGPGGSFGIIAAPVDVLAEVANASLRKAVRGWIKPRCGLPAFLETYSLNGGTHHCALVMGDCLEGILAFASCAELDAVVIR